MFITRFAPEPSGFLHLGNLKTILYSYLFSKKNNGIFILRIENTNFTNFNIVYLISILKIFRYLNISYLIIYFQSKRLNLYIKIAFYLINKNFAYIFNNVVYLRCKIKKKIYFIDFLRGKIFNNFIFNDFVILKSNGFPTYNFCCSVDDIFMKISHVFRGEDHIKNTFKQIYIFTLIGAFFPKYLHLSLLFDLKGNKLSKGINKSIDKNVIFFSFNKNFVFTILNLGVFPFSIFLYLLNLNYLNCNSLFSLKYLLNFINIKNIKISNLKSNFRKVLYFNKKFLFINFYLNFSFSFLCFCNFSFHFLNFYLNRSTTLNDLFFYIFTYFKNLFFRLKFRVPFIRKLIIYLNLSYLNLINIKNIFFYFYNIYGIFFYQNINKIFFCRLLNNPNIIDIIISNNIYFLITSLNLSSL
ncbi:MAG: glutamate--tRNA ligase family protein [Candidatus Vidania fulgoroideorum]